MWGHLRKNAATIAVAMATAAVTAGAPALAHGVKHALFAHNSAAVDGKSAVGAEATKSQRKGKLVATDPVTGRLPNNLIKKAPNADKLDGLDSTKFLQNSGAITIQGNGWTKAPGGSGTATLEPQIQGARATSTSTSGNATYVAMPDLPVTMYGKVLKLTGVEVCYNAETDFFVDTIALERVVDTNGVPAETTETLDPADRSQNDCSSFLVDVVLSRDENVGVSIETDWDVTSETLDLGRVTFTLVPTDDIPPS